MTLAMLAAAAVCGGHVLAPGIEMLGFTADGGTAAWRVRDLGAAAPPALLCVASVGSGKSEEVPDEAAWLRDHPLTPAVRGMTSPEGVAPLTLRGRGQWKGGIFACEGIAVGGDEEFSPAYLAADLVALAGGHPLGLVGCLGDKMLLEPFWENKGRAVALTVFRQMRKPRPEDALMVVVAPLTLRPIELVAGRGALTRNMGFYGHVEVGIAEVFGGAAAAIRALGYAPVRSGTALQERQATVVFHEPGAKAEAERIASALPGGATVEPLTWKAAAPLVVALGKSAATEDSGH